METPRQRLDKLKIDGFYGTNNQFAELIKQRCYRNATKIMNSLNQGFLWENERLVHSQIYDLLLDGKSGKYIKNIFYNH